MKRMLAFLLLCACIFTLLTGCACAPDAAAPTAEPTAPLTVSTATPEPDAPEPTTDGDVRVLFLNVGRADAILVEAGGRCALIDTGEKEAVPQLFAALRYLGCDAPGLVFLTHTHSDHIGGMEALSQNCVVPAAYAAVISENKKNGENKITELCRKVGVPLTRLSPGDAVPLSPGVSFSVLGPLVYNGDDDNDNSLVLRLTVNGRTLLLTGDMQFAEEESLLKAGVDLSADILKVGNHGNPDATGDAFALAVSPSIAVIPTSVAVDADSANARVIAALAGAKIYITEQYPLGVLVTISPDGAMAVSSPEPVKSDAWLTVLLDLERQTVAVENRGAESADLSGFVLYSARGGECFRFPEEAALEPGASLTVGGAGGGADFSFPAEEAPWNKKKGDTAILFDAGGHIVAES